MRFLSFLVFGFFAAIILSTTACKKEQLLTSGGELKFSTDTVAFDTVFTSLGSFTVGLKIFNPQNQKINISSVRLEKGTASYFHLNVNGIPGNNVTDLEVAAHDSIYVFATVKINPNDSLTPFIVEDRLIATLNGNDYSIQVFAYGQNAYYLRDSVIDHDDTWKTDKPYVILHSAAVDRGVTLTIPAGCRIYMHADSRLLVLGKLLAQGTKQDSIIFQGDRLDRAYFGYQGYPGEWGGIYFDSSSTGSKMDWCVLKNCGNSSGGGLPFALEVFGKPGSPDLQLTMSHTIIENAIGYGILSFGGRINADNCLVHDCGAQALAIFQGGTYTFTNCDFLNYFPKKVSHSDEPTVAVLNYFPVNNTAVVGDPLDITFTNCLIYGSLDNEFFSDKVDDVTFKATYKNCMIKTENGVPVYTAPHNVTLQDSLVTQDPKFVDYEKWNYRLKQESPLIDKGINNFTTDLDDVAHTINGITDVGCYEFKP